MADEPDTSAYIGVSHDYQNYASDHFKPEFSGEEKIAAQEKALKKAEENATVTDASDLPPGAPLDVEPGDVEVAPAAVKVSDLQVDENTGQPKSSPRRTAERKQEKE